MVSDHRPVPPTIRWGWVPPAASAIVHVALAVTLLVFRVDFLKVAAQLGIDSAGRRMCSAGAILAAAFTAWRGAMEARKAIRLYRERQP